MSNLFAYFEIFDRLCCGGELTRLFPLDNTNARTFLHPIPDTEPIYESIVGDIAKLYGKPYLHEVRMRVLGTTEQMMAKIAVTDLGLPITPAEFHRLFSELCRQRFRNLELMEGAERLLLHLHKCDVPMALATSSSIEMAEIKMTNHEELFSLFNHKVMGSTDPDVKIGKPAPDIFLVAGKRFADKPIPENVSSPKDTVEWRERRSVLLTGS